MIFCYHSSILNYIFSSFKQARAGRSMYFMARARCPRQQGTVAAVFVFVAHKNKKWFNYNSMLC